MTAGDGRREDAGICAAVCMKNVRMLDGNDRPKRSARRRRWLVGDGFDLKLRSPSGHQGSPTALSIRILALSKGHPTCRLSE
jgi:hypothetical protein